MSDDLWDYRVEALGAPESVVALERTRELTAQGWQLLGVHFSTGKWHFRRARSDKTNAAELEEPDA